MSGYDFDLFVMGAGSGGVRAARMSAAYGARVATAEDRHMGGTCVNVGCIPKKLFVYASHFREEREQAEGFGWRTDNPQFDWHTLRENKDKEINRLNGIYAGLLKNAGVTHFDGRARIVDEHHVSIDNDQLVSCENILIATGSWPDMLEMDGHEHLISSNEVFNLEALPEKAVVVGGGYIAVEFAGIFNGLGVETHLLYRGPLFLRGFDDDVRKMVAEEMRKKGVHLHFDTEVMSIKKPGENQLELTLTDESILQAGLALCATGRLPAIHDIGLESVDVKTADYGAITVDDEFRTSVPNIFALGDVIDRFQLTPVAIAEAMVVAENLFLNHPTKSVRKVDYANIATAVFCQPNIGTVGLTEAEARDQYSAVEIYRSEFRALKHTLSGSDEKTMMKLIVDKETDKVVGVHMVGPEAGEIIQGIAVALKAGATKTTFDSTIGIHPTLAEELVTMREPVS